MFTPDDFLQSALNFTNSRTLIFHETSPQLEKPISHRKIDFLEKDLRGSISVWYHESCSPILAATMSLNQFLFIICFLQFDGRSTW